MPGRDLSRLIELRYDLTLDVYRQRARALAVSAKSDKDTPSIVYYVQEFIGPDLMASIALAFDPYWQFRDLSDSVRNPKSQLLRSFLPVKVVPVNRTKFGVGIFGYKVIETFYTQGVDSLSTGLDPNSSPGWALKYASSSTPGVPNVSTRAVQAQILSWRKDTTWKSRNPGVEIKRKTDKSKLNKQGEFERSSWTIDSFSPPYSSVRYFENYQLQAVPPFTLWAYLKQWYYRNGHYTDGLCATVSRTDITPYESSEQAFALSMMNKYLGEMLPKCLPSRRSFNLYYQMTELKDLPATLRSSLKLWSDIEHQLNKVGFIRALSDVKFWTPSRVRQLSPSMGRVGVHWNADTKAADAYLTFKFGWQSMYQAAMQLLDTPTRATKDVNFLLSKQGQDVTLTTQKRFQLPPSAYPKPSFYGYTDWQAINADGPVDHTVTRSIILKLVVNSGINLPRLDTPKLRTLLISEKLGAVPTPKDLYDIVPWTWMIDWFVGLGDYVNMVGMINSDRQLINYGFMTYKSLTSVTSLLKMNVDQRADGSSSPPNTNWTTGWTESKLQQTCRLVNDYEIRRSISNLGSTKTYSGSGPLSSDQKTILGALFSKFL